MELQDSKAFVQNCFHDESASCACACPFHLDIRGFLKKVAKGRWPAAYRDLSTAILFPSIAAELCPQPCRARCQRESLGDEALNMAELEKACIRFANGEAADFRLPPKEETVAVVGAGPAGLACAIGLARKKYVVTVFEKEQGWGGHLRSHPRFALFDADFSKQFAPQSVDFRFGAEADWDILQNFNSVYIATGEGGEDFGLGSSWDSKNFTCEKAGFFLGGGVVGMPLMESIACGSKLSQLMEAYLKTGRAELIVENNEEYCEGHMMDHPGEEKKPIVLPADPDLGYTKDEAKAEAARCMQCICDRCMKECELMAHYRKSPYKLAADICGDSHTMPPFSNCEATRQTYSCNMCSHCSNICPEGVDMGELFRFSREDRWKQKKWVPGLHDYWLRELDFNGDEGFYCSDKKCDYLFFPGCQLSASSPNQVKEVWNYLGDKLDTGIMLGCCGAPAVWAGDLERREKNTSLIRSHWETMERPKIICACATCSDFLKKLIPGAEIISLYEMLNKLGAPVHSLPFSEAAVFDPCSASKDENVHSSVAAIAEKALCRVEKLDDGGKCCGYGGHMRLANPDLYKEITDNRVKESELPYIVYCANCLEVFRSKGKECAHILDAVFPPESYSTPTLAQKKANSLRLKGELMQEIENKNFIPSVDPWDNLPLEISAEAQANMEDKLITESEMKELIYTVEAERDYFEDESGLRSACLMKEVLTFWADYRQTEDGGYFLESAYCHRMHIGEDGK